jgi:hypothetical protein
MTANTGRNNAGEEILVFLVVGIGGIALLNPNGPRSNKPCPGAPSSPWARSHAPRLPMILGIILFSRAIPHLMIAVGVLIVVGALGSRLVGVGRRESQSGL